MPGRVEARLAVIPVTELETTPPAVVEAPENGARPSAAAAAGAAIIFDSVTKVYEPGVTALSDVSFVIEKGEFVFVVGASGSGKSTMIRLILKELDPTSGRIIVGGRDLVEEKVGGVKQVANRAFYKRQNVAGKAVAWVDAEVKDASQVEETVVRWSPRFFELLAATTADENARLSQEGDLLLRLQGRTVFVTDAATADR